MAADGIAIFLADPLTGQETPVEFAFGTDLESLESVWSAAVHRLGAKDAEELREEGYFAKVVDLTPMDEVDLGQRGFVERCLRLVDVDLEVDDCTTEVGDSHMTESVMQARLRSDRIRVPVAPHEMALPEFSTEYLDCRSEGDIELPLHFVLAETGKNYAVYSVRVQEALPNRFGGKMAASADQFPRLERRRLQG